MESQTFDCFDLQQTIDRVAAELKIPRDQVRVAIELLEDGNTLPFIARYRKEATRGLDETALRAIEDLLAELKDIAQRKGTILRSIADQGLLTADLQSRILNCFDKKTLEDLYLPFKPKRRTRATIARQRGLGPLADILLQQQRLGRSRQDILRPFVDPAQEVPDEAAALQGACDIVAETWAEDAATRSWLFDQARWGQIVSKTKRGLKSPDPKFQQYFDHREPIQRVPSHRLLAMKRGESEGVLSIGLALEDDVLVRQLKSRLVRSADFEFARELTATVEDCYQRLLLPAAESAIMQELKEKADAEAVNVFARNLRELLLAPPAGPRTTMGIDPGFRTGCKVAVVDPTGKLLAHTAIYPTPPHNDHQGAQGIVVDLITKYQVELIAIGNGTASRETDAFVTDVLRQHDFSITKVLVNESGASIYSASEVAVAEYPTLDVTVRGAISIAHRLQDPLAELVKIDPKSIGVGQYQHDVNQSLLQKSLQREVESCVNSVGVDINTASSSLLSYVAGIGPKLAQRIVQYRNDRGAFRQRSELLNVPKLGQKAYQQAAGFLRIRGGPQSLDNSSVHPESYYVVERMAKHLQVATQQLVGSAALVGRLRAEDFVDQQVGLPTIRDILTELAKPGRDPRREFRAAQFAEGIHELEDIRTGMVLEGVVTNVTKFGAFVDLGVHQDGLIHISQLADRYVADPSDEVSVGDIVRVKVLEVDMQRRRISLSRKQLSG